MALEKSVNLIVRFTPSEKEIIRAAADRLEMGMSEYSRKTLLESARAVLSENYKSDITHWSNSTGKVLIARLEAAKIMDENDT